MKLKILVLLLLVSVLVGCVYRNPHYNEIHYGDKVKIIRGFYYGNTGVVVDYDDWRYDNKKYTVTLDNGKQEGFGRRDLKKIL